MNEAMQRTTRDGSELRELAPGEVYVGRCALWDASRRYGFLRVSNARDIFAHKSRLVGVTELERGDRVTFRVAVDAAGRKVADQVTRLDEPTT